MSCYRTGTGRMEAMEDGMGLTELGPVGVGDPSTEGTYVCRFSPHLVEVARQELQEKPEWRLRDIQALRDMLKEHPEIPAPTDDGFLLRFLRARKFDYDKALLLIDNYYKCRRVWPDVFVNFYPSSVRHVLEAGVVTALPQPDAQGRRIIVLRPGLWNPAVAPATDMLRVLYMTLEMLVRQEETQVCGLVVLADYAGLGLAHASHLGPAFARRVATVLQDAFPVRVKAVNIFNEPIIMKAIFAIVKPFLKEKLQKRYYFHGSDLSSLHRSLPPGVLPNEYGGAAGPLDAQRWALTLLDWEPFFLREFGGPVAIAPTPTLGTDGQQLQIGTSRAASQYSDEAEEASAKL
ncbi:alpha-tocopherol transfer protein-like [Lampetra fluviatilis]